MKTIILAAALTCACLPGLAQKNSPSRKFKFSSVNQFGLLLGEKGESVSLQTINGVRKSSWSAGIGTGIDLYSQRSVPLFIDVRKEFTQASNKPFVYLDGGVNFQWMNYIQKEQRRSADTKPGAYYEAGLGYNIFMRHQSAFVLSAGYTYKRIREEYMNYRLMRGVYGESPEQMISQYRRLVIRIGIRL